MAIKNNLMTLPINKTKRHHHHPITTYYALYKIESGLVVMIKVIRRIYTKTSGRAQVIHDTVYGLVITMIIQVTIFPIVWQRCW